MTEEILTPEEGLAEEDILNLISDFESSEGVVASPVPQIVPKETQVASVVSDVGELQLLENVFDKRVTEEQVKQQMYEESNKNDSGRLLDKKDVEVKTELNDVEIVTISKLLFVADRYDVPVIKNFVDNIMTLKISRKRQGRREFIQGLHADERSQQPNEGFFSRIFGGNKGEPQ